MKQDISGDPKSCKKRANPHQISKVYFLNL